MHDNKDSDNGMSMEVIHIESKEYIKQNDRDRIDHRICKHHHIIRMMTE